MMRTNSLPTQTTGGYASLWRRWWYLPVFIAYVALIFTAIAHHEPWFDEGQAWLLARDLHPWYLLTYMLRYEGSPGLWHIILMLPARYLPYAALNVIAGLIATAGIWIFLSRSPMPKLLTVLFPFTFFLSFQYAVIARSYVLLPLLLFAAAALYPEKRRHAVLYVMLLCLLANVSIHGMLIALALMFLHFLDLLPDWRAMLPAERNRHIILFAAFAGVLALIVWQLWLPDDLQSVTGHRESLFERAMNGYNALNHAMADKGFLTAIILVLSLIWFWRTRVLASYLLPTLALLAFFILKYYNAWHEGILFLVWLFALWRSFDAYARMGEQERNQRGFVLARNGMCLAAATLIVVQLFWAGHTIKHDIMHNYSGNKAVAQYLTTHHLTTAKICAYSFHANGILPYFNRNIFANFDDEYGASFWFWSKRQKTDMTLSDVLRRKPDVLILGIKFDSLAKLPWEQPGFRYDISNDYRYAGYFDGKMYWKDRVKEYDAFALYLRKSYIAAQERSGQMERRSTMRQFKL